MINDNLVINGIILDLKIAIDQLSVDSIRAKNLILELGRRLDEQDKCEKSEISTKVKEILADKIKDNKISSKWIEECLPTDYKRKYTRKSELASLSKKTEDIKVQDSNVIDTNDNGDGSIFLISHDTRYTDSSDNKEGSLVTGVTSNGFERQEYETSFDHTDPDQILKEENRQLREALRQTKMVMGDQIGATEKELKIPKEKYYEIKEAMSKSKYFTYMIFDNRGIMLRVVADIFKTI